MHEFSIGETRFRLAPLKLKESLRAEAILAEAVIPAFVAAAGGFASADVAKALAGLGRLPELVDIFAGACQFDQAPKKVDGSVAGERWLALSTGGFLDSVFERRNAALLAWIVACTEYQFADFFDGTGKAILAPAGNRFASLLVSTGGSGES